VVVKEVLEHYPVHAGGGVFAQPLPDRIGCANQHRLAADVVGGEEVGRAEMISTCSSSSSVRVAVSGNGSPSRACSGSFQPKPVASSARPPGRDRPAVQDNHHLAGRARGC
jgi:hypothetical protein